MDFDTEYLTKPSKKRPGISLSPGVGFIVGHDTRNHNSTASVSVSYYESSSGEMSASADVFVDDREITECTPALLSDKPGRTWHAIDVGLIQGRRTYDQLPRNVVTESGDALPEPEIDKNQSSAVASTVKLNVRKGEMNTRAPIYRTGQAGTSLQCA